MDALPRLFLDDKKSPGMHCNAGCEHRRARSDPHRRDQQESGVEGELTIQPVVACPHQAIVQTVLCDTFTDRMAEDDLELELELPEAYEEGGCAIL